MVTIKGNRKEKYNAIYLVEPKKNSNFVARKKTEANKGTVLTTYITH